MITTTLCTCGDCDACGHPAMCKHTYACCTSTIGPMCEHRRPRSVALHWIGTDNGVFSSFKDTCGNRYTAIIELDRIDTEDRVPCAHWSAEVRSHNVIDGRMTSIQVEEGERETLAEAVEFIETWVACTLDV